MIKTLADYLLTDKNLQRFRSRIIEKSATECWEYFPHAGNGAGTFTDDNLKVWKPSRLAYLIMHENIDTDLLVCHSCDNACCCNPFHLRQGTYQDNADDMRSRGRGKGGPGGPNKISVIDLKTGIIYSSIAEASRLTHHSTCSIREVINKRSKIFGINMAKIEPL